MIKNLSAGLRFLLPVFSLFVLLTAGHADSGVSRQILNFDTGWHFFKGDAPGAESPNFNDSGWSMVDVPHDWSIEGPYDEKAPSGSGGGYLPTGISWYRKTFTLPAASSDRKVSIEFDGVMANATVWINGHELGQRQNGYVAFSYDLTPYLEPGKENILAVKTDTTLQPASRWYTGQGIYRHVRLVTTDSVHVAKWGLYITTPKITDSEALIHVRTTIENNSKTAAEVSLQTVLTGPDGKEAARNDSTSQTIDPGKAMEFTQDLTVNHPALWGLQTPNIYRAVVRVTSNRDHVTDEITQPFGIRNIAFKADTGFWLNGQNIKIKGVCLHHEGGAVGSAVPLSIWERRLNILRSLGVNAIRTSHNPPAPEFLDLCDRMGFLVMLESFDTWSLGKAHAEKGYNLYFNDWWKTDWSDILRWERNHPSIVIWSIGNEIDGKFGVLHTNSLLDSLVDQIGLAHQLDPTRPVTLGLIAPRKKDQIPSVTDLFDVAGVNYQPWDLALIAMDGKPVIGTEEAHDLYRWALYRDNPALSGCFLWTGIDYIGETKWPNVICQLGGSGTGFGLLEIGETIRPRGYQRQSWWTQKPMVSMARYTSRGNSDDGTGPLLRDWTPPDPSKYDKAVVEVYSNTDEVELFLNGKSLGTKKVPPSGTPLTWLVPFAPGTLKAVAKKVGQIAATDELTTAGSPVRIVLASDRSQLKNTFDDVACITANIVDAKGVVCPNSSDLLKFDVMGPGKIVGVASGALADHRPFPQPQREAYHGTCVGIVRTTASSGEMTITVSASGLPSASTKIGATAP